MSPEGRSAGCPSQGNWPSQVFPDSLLCAACTAIVTLESWAQANVLVDLAGRHLTAVLHVPEALTIHVADTGLVTLTAQSVVATVDILFMIVPRNALVGQQIHVSVMVRAMMIPQTQSDGEMGHVHAIMAILVWNALMNAQAVLRRHVATTGTAPVMVWMSPLNALVKITPKSGIGREPLVSDACPIGLGCSACPRVQRIALDRIVRGMDPVHLKLKRATVMPPSTKGFGKVGSVTSAKQGIGVQVLTTMELGVPRYVLPVLATRVMVMGYAVTVCMGRAGATVQAIQPMGGGRWTIAVIASGDGMAQHAAVKKAASELACVDASLTRTEEESGAGHFATTVHLVGSVLIVVCSVRITQRLEVPYVPVTGPAMTASQETVGANARQSPVGDNAGAHRKDQAHISPWRSPMMTGQRAAAAASAAEFTRFRPIRSSRLSQFMRLSQLSRMLAEPADPPDLFYSDEIGRFCGGFADACDDGRQGTGVCHCPRNLETGFWEPPACDDCVAGYGGEKCIMSCPSAFGQPCAGHGTCSDGVKGTGDCNCQGGWTSPSCSFECPGSASNPCRGAGDCVYRDGAAVCDCYAHPEMGYWDGDLCDRCLYGYSGQGCTLACPMGTYIELCDKEDSPPDCVVGTPVPNRVCSTRGTCRDGICYECLDFWCGDACDVGGPESAVTKAMCSAVLCPPGRYGPDCDDPNCQNCECPSTTYSDCNILDDDGTTGAECTHGDLDCLCAEAEVCSGNGLCEEGKKGSGDCLCSDGWAGSLCSIECLGVTTREQGGVVQVFVCSGNGQCNHTTGVAANPLCDGRVEAQDVGEVLQGSVGFSGGGDPRLGATHRWGDSGSHFNNSGQEAQYACPFRSGFEVIPGTTSLNI
eukprot:gene16085-biopygen7141